MRLPKPSRTPRSTTAGKVARIGGAVVLSVGIAAAGVAAARRPAARAAKTRTPTARSGVRPGGGESRPVIPAASSPYEPILDEVSADAKLLAAEVARRLTNYDAGTRPSDLAAAVVPEGDRRRALEVAAAPLYRPGAWSRGAIVYPQLGGMRPASASVMVVVRQTIGSGDRGHVETRTLDVRLARDAGVWRFDELASAGGDPVARPADLPAEAIAVLDDRRIELPDSARWDIYRGHVSVTLLRLMSRIADRAPYAVAVLESGHPFHIFGTSRQSAHTRGQAVDIYRLGDRHVVEDRHAAGTTADLVRWLYVQPETAQIGSPWALDGRGGRSFTDVVHQDHVHVAVRA